MWIVMWNEMVSGVYGNWQMKMYIDRQRLRISCLGETLFCMFIHSVMILSIFMLYWSVMV